MSRKLYILSLMLLSPLSLFAVNVSGTILYERVHPAHSRTNSSLNFSNITQEAAKQVLVEAINEESNTVSSTYTDNQGKYSLSNLSSNTNIKIRVYAKMFKQSLWDVKVIDNKNKNSLYVIEGNSKTTGFNDSIRNLLATSSNKSSPPFAILDSVYQAMQKVHAVDAGVQFPSLKMNWSTKNIASGTYYDGIDNIVLQGDQRGDSDEYDDHIIIHEWGHFFEEKLSRADNIGKRHQTGDRLDIRVAFGEGFGNALSAIVTDDPIYFDTIGKNGWNMNIENASHQTPGWFSEASVQRILYDLYDTPTDRGDNLALGFQPIYKTLTTGQKTTPAFTSLFSFITELKKDNPTVTGEIDNIVANENIATIEDSYGSNRISNLEASELPLYRELTLNTTIENVCTKSNGNQLYNNKLSNHKYVRFSIPENNTYPIQIKQTNGNNSNPNFTLFKTSPFENYAAQENGTAGIEEVSLALTSGDYILDIYDAKKRTKACFNVSVGKVTSVTNPDTNNSQNTDSPSNTQTIGIGLPENKFLAFFMMLLILFVPLLFIRKELKI